MPYSAGYTDTRFTGTKPLGQFSNTQTYQTPSFLEDKATVLGKEVKGGHLVKYKSLLTENTYSGVLSSRRQIGMLVYVELNDDDTALGRFYYLSANQGYSLSDWTELSFIAEPGTQTYVRTDLPARDALTGMVTGDLAIVEDARTPAEITAADPVYAAIYAWNGSSWVYINLLGDLTNFHTQNTDTQLIKTSDGQPITADYIAAELGKKIEKDDTMVTTDKGWSSQKIADQDGEVLQAAKDYTYSQQVIDEANVQVLTDANAYTDTQVASVVPLEEDHGVQITPLSKAGASPVNPNAKFVHIKLEDIANSGSIASSWVKLITDGTYLYLDTAGISAGISPSAKTWAGLQGETTFLLEEAEQPVAGVFNVFVGGAIQKPSEYTVTLDTLLLNTALEQDMDVILIYSRLASASDVDAKADTAYVDAAVSSIRGTNLTDTLATLRDDITVLESATVPFPTIQRFKFTTDGVNSSYNLSINIGQILNLFTDETWQDDGFSVSGTNLIFDVLPPADIVVKGSFVAA